MVATAKAAPPLAWLATGAYLPLAVAVIRGGIHLGLEGRGRVRSEPWLETTPSSGSRPRIEPVISYPKALSTSKSAPSLMTW